MKRVNTLDDVVPGTPKTVTASPKSSKRNSSSTGWGTNTAAKHFSMGKPKTKTEQSQPTFKKTAEEHKSPKHEISYNHRVGK